MLLWRKLIPVALVFTLENFFQELHFAQCLKVVFSDKAEDVEVVYFTVCKRGFQRSLWIRLEGRAAVGEHMEWIRKYREHCGPENRREGSHNGLCFE